MSNHTPIAPSRIGQPLTLRARKGAFQRQASVATFGQTAASSAIPFISGKPRIGESLSLDTTGLTGVTGQEWFQDDVSQSMAETFSPTQATASVYCRVTHADGISETPAVWIYMDHATAKHNQDDDNTLALVPHPSRTIIAVADGDWSDPATWNTGSLPTTADRVLIPQGRDLTYDVASSPRLWDIRIDGTLRWSLTQSTHLLVETIVVTATGSIIIGESVNNRVPAHVRHEVVISDRSFALDQTASASTVLDIASDPGLLGRGLLCQGLFRTFAAEVTPWLFCQNAAWPMAGDTTLTLAENPVGWEVGKTIAVQGSRIYMADGNGKKGQVTTEDEVVTITDITNNVVTFMPALQYDHDDDLDRLIHTEAEDFTVPAVMYQDRNIILRSEAEHDAEPWKRGHSMVMHGPAVCDIWGLKVLNMGRTNKRIGAGILETNGQFRFVEWTTTDIGDNNLQYAAPSPEMNLISRYPLHAHFLGFNRGAATAIMRDCYVEGVVGWGMVQHGCAAKFIRNCIYRFTNGMISETGNEVDVWSDNCVFGCTTSVGQDANVKFTEGTRSARGDKFRAGVCYGFTGRALRTVRNHAGSAPHGYIFSHRSGKVTNIDDPNSNISPSIKLKRENVDFATLSELNWQGGEITTNDMPIRHFVGNSGSALRRSLQVTKSGPGQNTDLGVNLRDNRFWAVSTGAFQEYVSTYNWVNTYAQVAQQNLTGTEDVGLSSGGATFQITYLRPKIIGGTSNDMVFSGGNKFALPEDFSLPGHPMFAVFGPYPTAANLKTQFNHPSTDPATWIAQYGDMALVTRIEDTVPAFVKPTISGPLVAYHWNGNANPENLSNVGSWLRNDSLGAQPLWKPWDPIGMAFGSYGSDTTGDRDFTRNGTGAFLRTHAQRVGYWEWDDNGTMRDVLLIRLEHSDRLDGYPINHMYLCVCEGQSWEDLKGPLNLVNNGTFTPTTVQPTRADIQTTCPKGGSVTLDILGAATSEAGTTIDYLRADVDGAIKVVHLKPDHGDLTINADNTVTYTPDGLYESFVPFTGLPVSPDIFYMFLYDGRSGFETVRVEVTVS